MALEEVLARIRSQAEPRQSEDKVTRHIVLPILHALGWDITKPLVVRKQYGVAGSKVDIALRDADRVLAILELKKYPINLQFMSNQIKRYMQAANVEIGVLTSGKEWWFYYMEKDATERGERFLVLDAFAETIESVAKTLKIYLDKDALMNGSAAEIAKQKDHQPILVEDWLLKPREMGKPTSIVFLDEQKDYDSRWEPFVFLVERLLEFHPNRVDSLLKALDDDGLPVVSLNPEDICRNNSGPTSIYRSSSSELFIFIGESKFEKIENRCRNVLKCFKEYSESDFKIWRRDL